MQKDRHTYTRTGRQTDRNTDGQTGIQADILIHRDRQTDILERQEYRRTDMHTDRQIYRHTDKQTYIHTDKQTYIHTDRQRDIQTYRQTGINADHQTGKHTDIHIDRQTDIQTDINKTRLSRILLATIKPGTGFHTSFSSNAKRGGCPLVS
jgi:hypothetical protein